MAKVRKALPEMGWREWVALPGLGVPHIKAKIDTGARTSALHAYDLDIVEENGMRVVHFIVHPRQRETHTTIRARAKLVEMREVKNSGGKIEHRPVIHTPVKIGEYQWDIDITLTRRDTMGFRLLLGRKAVAKKFLVNPGRSFVYGRRKKRT